MSQLLLQDVRETSLNQLEALAAVHHRSLQLELRAILEAAAATVDPSFLRGWGEALPAPVPEDARPDALDRLEATMAQAVPEARLTPFQPRVGENAEPDSVDLLLQYMETNWKPAHAQRWLEDFQSRVDLEAGLPDDSDSVDLLLQYMEGNWKPGQFSVEPY